MQLRLAEKTLLRLTEMVTLKMIVGKIRRVYEIMTRRQGQIEDIVKFISR